MGRLKKVEEAWSLPALVQSISQANISSVVMRQTDDLMGHLSHLNASLAFRPSLQQGLGACVVGLTCCEIGPAIGSRMPLQVCVIVSSHLGRRLYACSLSVKSKCPRMCPLCVIVRSPLTIKQFHIYFVVRTIFLWLAMSVMYTITNNRSCCHSSCPLMRFNAKLSLPLRLSVNLLQP